MGIMDWVFENLPLIGFGVTVVALVLYFMFRETKESIENRVEVFFKGGTKEIFPCIVERDTIRFTIGKTEFNEPVIHHPRVSFDRQHGSFFRDYMYAEGLGSVEVPPLPPDDKKKILEHLVSNGIIKLGDEKKSVKDFTDEELTAYIKFYNFDIEQITERPMGNAFIMTINMFSSMVTSMIQGINTMEGKGTSNIAKLAFVVIGIAIGFGFAWALTLKGVI